VPAAHRKIAADGALQLQVHQRFARVGHKHHKPDGPTLILIALILHGLPGQEMCDQQPLLPRVREHGLDRLEVQLTRGQGVLAHVARGLEVDHLEGTGITGNHQGLFLPPVI
jgi:hypothetical protein